ncbi:hypothetical protein FQN50_000129 [Emmonsiellopsis sp. PD_5]|nr:hypothetical protein FQN50_000129 [Emmonsiellopsis sp. PD_5]
MPVTVNLRAQIDPFWNYNRTFFPISSVEELLGAVTCKGGDYKQDTADFKKNLIQSSLPDIPPGKWFGSKNGFVCGCIEACNTRGHLVIRPDDVWLAILTQFGAYVNASGEKLRHLFVDHSGEEELHIHVNPEGVDRGKVAIAMGERIQTWIKDQAKWEWIIPKFSTTTDTDVAIAGVSFTGTMGRCSISCWGFLCGLPSVTLLGTIEDWKMIRQKVEKLPIYGEEPAMWHKRLDPILRMLVRTFSQPKSEAVTQFWQTICDSSGGSTMHPGWITAFCFWDENGVCLRETRPENQAGLQLHKMSAGFAKMPVTLLKEGDRRYSLVEMLAGSVGLQVTSKDSMGQENCNTIQPVTGWFLYKV